MCKNTQGSLKELAQHAARNSFESLLSAIKYILQIVHMVTRGELLQKIIIGFLKSHYSARNFLKIGRDDFEKFVVCQKCESLYNYSECVINLNNGKAVSKKCSYVTFPDHTRERYRQPCGEVLMKTMMNEGVFSEIHHK